MLEIIVFYLTLLCTNPMPHAPGKKCNGIHLANPDTETGGENGGPLPPPPPPPPPPPSS